MKDIQQKEKGKIKVKEIKQIGKDMRDRQRKRGRVREQEERER